METLPNFARILGLHGEMALSSLDLHGETDTQMELEKMKIRHLFHGQASWQMLVSH